MSLNCNASQVVPRDGKFEHITPALIKLHWLPVKQRFIQTGFNNF